MKIFWGIASLGCLLSVPSSVMRVLKPVSLVKWVAECVLTLRAGSWVWKRTFLCCNLYFWRSPQTRCLSQRPYHWLFCTVHDYFIYRCLVHFPITFGKLYLLAQVRSVVLLWSRRWLGDTQRGHSSALSCPRRWGQSRRDLVWRCRWDWLNAETHELLGGSQWSIFEIWMVLDR